MSVWKVCLECNDIQELESDIHVICYKCRIDGHLYYMMSISELLESAKNDSRSGRELEAIKKREIAIKLSRVEAIYGCINVASQEYGEALREGLDCNGAHECLMEGLSELLKLAMS